MIGRFATGAAYRQALEARLMAAYGAERIQRGRKRLSIERLVVRIQEQRPSGFLVKGGFALELRLRGASRTTRDLDLAAGAEIGDDLDSVADEIEAACQIDARDGFEFRPAGIPELLPGAEVGKTYRYSIAARLDGRLFEQVPVDVRVRDFVPADSDTVTGGDWLSLIGLPPPRIRILPLAYHFAEKVHALTLPRRERNSRIRDLVDLALLIELGTPSGRAARDALREVFEHRGTHPLPGELPQPPAEWEEGFASLTRSLPSVSQEMAEAFEPVARFYRQIGG